MINDKLSDKPGYSAIEYRSLSDITAEKLRNTIIAGDLQPGARITENDIAENMGVSRVVVREAILMLIQEGLLVKERNKYTMVTEISTKDVEDIFDFRIAIEQAAAKRCATNGCFVNTLLPQLTVLSDQINSASKTGKLTKDLVYMDMSFHNLLVKSSGNSRLMKAWQELSGPLLLLLYRYINLGCALHYSHEEILNAFRSNEIDAIEGVIFTHIQDTKLALLSTYQS